MKKLTEITVVDITAGASHRRGKSHGVVLLDGGPLSLMVLLIVVTLAESDPS